MSEIAELWAQNLDRATEFRFAAIKEHLARDACGVGPLTIDVPDARDVPDALGVPGVIPIAGAVGIELSPAGEVGKEFGSVEIEALQDATVLIPGAAE